MIQWACVKCGYVRNGDDGMQRTLIEEMRVAFCIKCNKKQTFTAAGPVKVADTPGQARRSDPPTSKAAATTIRTGSAKALLLAAHKDHPDGLTDEEAAQHAGLSLASEYATRCSELVHDGLLATTTDTRVGNAGMHRVVRKITEKGMLAV